MARETHAAEFAFFRVDIITFYFNKNSHGAHIDADGMYPAAVRPVADGRIDPHFRAYRCCGSDLHEKFSFFCIWRGPDGYRPGLLQIILLIIINL